MQLTLTVPVLCAIPLAPLFGSVIAGFFGTKLGGNSEVTTNNKGTVNKVIVTETDITETQNKVKGIIRKATIK